MSAQHSKGLVFVIAPVTVVALVQEAQGVTQTAVAVATAIVTIACIHLVARFVWSPLLERAGFWWSSALLAIAFVIAGVTAAVIGINFHVAAVVWRLSITATLEMLMFSWALAALQGAEERNRPETAGANAH